jgi:hypothetical protein
MPADESRPMVGTILRTLDGLHQGLLASRQKEQDTLLRPAEGRRKLGGILSREPSGRARPGVGQAPAPA